MGLWSHRTPIALGGEQFTVNGWELGKSCPAPRPQGSLPALTKALLVGPRSALRT